MHAFLSKIFGRKKDDKKDEETSPTALSPTQLLDGKFEAVSPTVSPSAAKFLELDQTTSERDNGASSAKATTRPTSVEGKSSKLDTLPHLSLNFGETRTDGFLLDDEIQGLSDNLIGERRLNPLEALLLIRSCSQAITAHGAWCSESSVFCASNSNGLVRPRNPGSYAPTLVFCFARTAAQTHITIPTFPIYQTC